MIIEYKVMPEDGEVEYSKLEEVTKKTVESFKDDVKIIHVLEEAVGFGLKAVLIKFQQDENNGSEELENQLTDLPEVGEVSVTFMDRL